MSKAISFQSRIILVSVCFLCVYLLALSAQCDVVNIYGVNFYVEKFEELGNGQARVKLGDDERIMGLREAQMLIIEAVFSSKGKASLSPNEIKKFVVTAISSDDRELSALGLAQLAKTIKISKLYEFLIQELTSSQLRYALEVVIPYLDPRNGITAANRNLLAMLAVAYLDGSIIKQNQGYINNAIVPFVASDITLRYVLPLLIVNQDLERTLNLKTFFKSIDDEQFKLARTISEHVYDYLVALQANNFSKSAGLLSSISKRYRSAKMEELIATMERVLVSESNRYIKKLVQNHNYAEILRLVALLPFHRRTEITHSYLLTAINALDHREWQVLLEPHVSVTIAKYAEKDPLIKQAFVSKLQRIFEYLRKNVDVYTAEKIVHILTQAKTDDAVLDSMRLKLIHSALVQGDKNFAYLTAHQLKRSPSVIDTLILFWDGFYLNKWVARVFLLLFLASFCAWCYRKYLQIQEKKRKLEAEKKAAERWFDFEKRLKEDLSHSQADRDRAEDVALEESLKVLGLSKNATIKDVKKAFKALVKEIHPDREPSGDDNAFIRINEAYQVALEILGKKKK